MHDQLMSIVIWLQHMCIL